MLARNKYELKKGHFEKEWQSHKYLLLFGCYGFKGNNTFEVPDGKKFLMKGSYLNSILFKGHNRLSGNILCYFFNTVDYKVQQQFEQNGFIFLYFFRNSNSYDQKGILNPSGRRVDFLLCQNLLRVMVNINIKLKFLRLVSKKVYGDNKSGY